MAVSNESSSASTAYWSAIFSISFVMFCLVTAQLLPVSILTPMATDMRVSIGAAGQVMTVAAAVAAIASPLLILGAGRFDRRRIVWGLTATLACSCLVTGAADNYWQLLFGRGLLGVAIGGLWAMVVSLALRLAPPEKVSLAISIIFTGISVANVVAPSAGALVSEIWGWRVTFFAVGAIGLVALAALLLTMPKLPSEIAPSLASFRIAGTRGSVVVGIVTVMLVYSGQFAAFTYFRPFLEQVSRLDINAISLILFAFGIGGIVGNLAAGPVAAGSAALCVGIASVALALALVALVFLGSQPIIPVVATVIWGIAFGAFPAGIATWNAEAAPDQAESAGALLASIFQVAVAIGASLGGSAVQMLGLKGAFACASIAVLAGAFVMFALGYRLERRRVLA